MSEYFPNAIVVPSIGNNDTKYHNQPPSGFYEEDYYAIYFDTYFKRHPRNSHLPEIDEI
jgi:hypothetical protein